MTDLQSPVSVLRGVGSRVAQRLAALGIETVQDVLFHLPMRYEDRTRIAPIGSLRSGNQATIEGAIETADVVYRRRRMIILRLADGSGSILLRFFHFSRQQQQSLRQGVCLRCYGEVRDGGSGLEMVHPEYRRIDDDKPPMEEALTAIYRTTEGLHQLSLRKLVDQVLALVDDGATVEELLPADLYADYGDYTLSEALRYLHRPPPDASLALISDGQHPCQKRLAFEELIAHSISMQQVGQRIRQQAAPLINGEGALYKKFIRELDFTLTGAQQKVIDEVINDLKKPHPMMRLVQGDVGSGKTIIAVVAALYVIESGYQAALMAPTEILAEQHFCNLGNWLMPLGIQLAWLSGSQKSKARRQALAAVESGEAQLVVGTHALFQEEVIFQNPALIVVDEQHRFGVHQRLRLIQKGRQQDVRPHQMIMTATPIPRTLAMSAYADLDTSVIDELPPGRRPVTTVVMPEERRSEVIARVRQAGNSRQVYWVCPLIEESEALQAQAATEIEGLLKEQLPELQVRLLHGRLKLPEKEQIMRDFKRRKIDVLVATTVIEVGVDVPDASLMVIENAERLGLSQLHQLRGRVGRGSEQSVCILLYKSPLGVVARRRLGVMRETTDGFAIAECDLDIRGPGEVLGTKQTGVMDLRVADLMRDKEMVEQAPAAAQIIFAQYPEIIQPLLRRWIKQRLEFAKV